MQITGLRLRKVNEKGKVRAYVTVTFDDCFVIHNVKVIQTRTGLNVAMPSRKTSNGDFKDIAHPITVEFRAEIREKILKEFYKGIPESTSQE